MAVYDNRWAATGAGTHNFGTNANWHDNTSPVNAESAVIEEGAIGCDIVNGMGLSAWTPAIFSLCSEFRGRCGMPAEPLVLGDVTRLTIDSPFARQIALKMHATGGVAEKCDDLEIYACGSEPGALHLQSVFSSPNYGEFTRAWAFGGYVTVAQGCKIGTLYVVGADVLIEPGALVGNLRVMSGVCLNRAAIGSAQVSGRGRLEHRGQGSDADVTLIDVYSGGTLLLNCKNGTLAEVNGHYGASIGGNGWENTLTAGELHKGAVMRLNRQWNVGAGFKLRGGDYAGPAGYTQEIAALPVGR